MILFVEIQMLDCSCVTFQSESLGFAISQLGSNLAQDVCLYIIMRM